MRFQRSLKWLSGSDSNAHDLVNSQADCQLSDPRIQIVGLGIICHRTDQADRTWVFPLRTADQAALAFPKQFLSHGWPSTSLPGLPTPLSGLDSLATKVATGLLPACLDQHGDSGMQTHIGAAGGNQTRIICLEGRESIIDLQPQGRG